MSDHIQYITQTPDAPEELVTFSPPLLSCPIPDYLLVDILANLDIFDLLICRSVCHLWKWNTDNRTLLKHKLFTAPPPPLEPTPEDSNIRKTPKIEYTIHPVFRIIEYHLYAQLALRNPFIKPLTQRTDFRLNDHLPYGSSVAGTFATAPATRKVVIKMCGGEMFVGCETGVKVWDVMVGLDVLMKDRHEKPDGIPSSGSRQLDWDCVQFPFAGFRIVSSTPDMIELKPEFYNLVEITRQFSRLPLKPITSTPLITFDVEDGVEM